MSAMKTPGVYIVEKNAFPNSIVQVATAVPAFIGHTETAMNGNTPLTMTPWRISSMAEFHRYFGGPPTVMFDLAEYDDKTPTELPGLTDETGATPDSLPAATITIPGRDASEPTKKYGLKIADDPAPSDASVASYRYALYGAMRLFFQNGGGPCWIVSVGGYDAAIEKDPMEQGIMVLKKEEEPTMVVIPEATRLTRMDCINVQQQMLKHCGADMKNRFAILDMFAGYLDRDGGDPVASFRGELGTNNLDYGAAYYPWVNTSIFEARDFGFHNIQAEDTLLVDLLKASANPAKLEDDDPKIKATFDEIEKIGLSGDKAPDPDILDKTLRAIAPLYVELTNKLMELSNCMSPGPAMAGIYTAVDAARGVWKAPANVSVNSVVSPTIKISHEDQEDLNVTPQGKSINAIRPFVGEGVLVWGARTLDGNSLDWRYVNVRRTMIMLEESVKLAAKAYVFEPNTANTWVTMRSMIENFLHSVWKAGGLAGAVPEDAYSVHVGLGETMTPVDILEGILRITVLVAVSRPAEFIEITFQQQLQKS